MQIKGDPLSYVGITKNGAKRSLSTLLQTTTFRRLGHWQSHNIRKDKVNVFGSRQINRQY